MDGYSILAENKEFSKLCTEGLAASEQLLGTGYAADLREARVGKCRCPCLLSDALKESKKDVYQVQGSGVASLKVCVLGISEGQPATFPVYKRVSSGTTGFVCQRACLYNSCPWDSVNL